MSGTVEGVDIGATLAAADYLISLYERLWKGGAVRDLAEAIGTYERLKLSALTRLPARSYADEDRVTIARALAERFIERGNARVTGSVHASWQAMPWSYRRDFLADADAVIKVLSQGEKV